MKHILRYAANGVYIPNSLEKFLYVNSDFVLAAK